MKEGCVTNGIWKRFLMAIRGDASGKKKHAGYMDECFTTDGVKG
jgi:hypothetical protein